MKIEQIWGAPSVKPALKHILIQIDSPKEMKQVTNLLSMARLNLNCNEFEHGFLSTLQESIQKAL